MQGSKRPRLVLWSKTDGKVISAATPASSTASMNHPDERQIVPWNAPISQLVRRVARSLAASSPRAFQANTGTRCHCLLYGKTRHVARSWIDAKWRLAAASVERHDRPVR